VMKDEGNGFGRDREYVSHLGQCPTMLSSEWFA
jgi:hypothetical protein